MCLASADAQGYWATKYGVKLVEEEVCSNGTSMDSCICKDICSIDDIQYKLMILIYIDEIDDIDYIQYKFTNDIKIRITYLKKFEVVFEFDNFEIWLF